MNNTVSGGSLLNGVLINNKDANDKQKISKRGKSVRFKEEDELMGEEDNKLGKLEIE